MTSLKELTISELDARIAEYTGDLEKAEAAIAELDPKVQEAGGEWGGDNNLAIGETLEEHEVFRLTYLQLAAKAYELMWERDMLKKTIESLKKEREAKTDTWQVFTAADALNFKRPEWVRIEDDYIVFTKRKYEIDLDRIKTRAALLEWIHHLSGKNWITSEMIAQFIEQVHIYRGWEIYNGV